VNRTVLVRSFALAACLAVACVAALAQQPAPRSNRGGLDNFSLPSRRAETSTPTAAGWQRFAPEGAGFSVMVPGVPEDTALTGRQAGALAKDFYDYHLKADGLDYEIARTGQLPKEVFEQGDFKDKFFAALPQNLAEAASMGMPQMNLKMVGERTVELGGYVGHEYEFASEQYRARVRFFIVDRAMLVFALTGPKAGFTQEKLKTYFDSFTLTP
jgi:hypothetical protein